jgi:hypothetical protein
MLQFDIRMGELYRSLARTRPISGQKHRFESCVLEGFIVDEVFLTVPGWNSIIVWFPLYQVNVVLYNHPYELWDKEIFYMFGEICTAIKTRKTYRAQFLLQVHLYDPRKARCPSLATWSIRYTGLAYKFLFECIIMKIYENNNVKIVAQTIIVNWPCH